MKWRRALLVLILLAVLAGAAWLARERHRERRYATEIEAAATRYGLDPLLVKALVWRESRFNPSLRGRHGEIGLMQLRKVAAQEWADAEKLSGFQHEHCLDPATNTLAGTYYLSKALKRHVHTDDPVPYALAEYNAGRSNVLKWNTGAAATNSSVFISQIGFPGTKGYVRSVVKRYNRYKSREGRR